ncbi:MAG TPA: tyrosinase family protein, partial [Nannocystis sp.]
TTSAGAWAKDVVVPLEQPHNDIHLALGGFNAPNLDMGGFPDGSGQVAGANGDMGENNTAALDPIFYFHHCNIDRLFWLWQKRNGHTDKLDVIKGYPGTNSSDSQGPTPGVAPGTALDVDSPLSPFSNPKTNVPLTSNDVVNIETQLGYTYGPGSFDEPRARVAAAVKRGGSTKRLTVRGIDRALFQGSFVVSAFATIRENGASTTRFLGHHSVLSRWSVIKCANCRTHLEVIAQFSLATLTDDEVKDATFSVKLQHRGVTPPRNLKIETSVGD